ncbi:MAG: hypothetical protein ACTHN5_11775 [Phycisphaerae bacterium]
MSATEEILARAAEATEGGGLEGRDLAALRAVLLGPERAQLRNLLKRLDDPAIRASEIAEILPEILALRAGDSGVAQTLSPIVGGALGEALRQRPELLARAARKALWQMMLSPWNWGRGLFRRKGKPACIEQLYLIERGSGEVLEKVMQPLAENDDAIEEGRRIASMVTYLLAFLRDPDHLMRYADLGRMRVERLTYGFHAGAQLVLLSVLRGDEGMEGELDRCRDMLMAADREWFNGKRGQAGWLPPLAGQKRVETLQNGADAVG